MEETIKKSFGKAFRNLRELFDKDTPKEEIAARFFELGWKAGVENMNNSIAKAKVGSWITLSEWVYSNEKGRYIPKCVKTEYVDGEKIKADTWYKLVDGEFKEVKP